MSRIAKLPLDRWDPELRAGFKADEGTALEQGLVRIMAHSPGIAKRVVALGAAFAEYRTLPPRLLELVRLRIAFHNQCRSCMAIRYRSAVEDGVTENLVCSLERPYEAPGLMDAERVAIRYADLSATDHLAINEATFDELRAHFSESQIVELGMYVAFCVGFGRLGAAWDMIEELPQAFKEKGERVAPWGAEAVVVRG
jgi:AhpD family alkylhydroperoxidase